MDDIAVAEIAAGLHLDRFQQNRAGIFQPVDVDRFALSRTA
jgi:hypothetical protein